MYNYGDDQNSQGYNFNEIKQRSGWYLGQQRGYDEDDGEGFASMMVKKLQTNLNRSRTMLQLLCEITLEIDANILIFSEPLMGTLPAFGWTSSLDGPCVIIIISSTDAILID